MLPENLVPARFHVSTVKNDAGEAEKDADLAQGKRTLADYESDILTNVNRTRQSRNMLLEERDRHIKDRLYRVVKIETFCRVLNDLQAAGEIDPQLLSQIITKKTTDINGAGKEIWLNLITHEKDTPMFYTLQDDSRE
ncbi:hypothetical protein C3369_14455 [Escherichia sp. ESNIH1]|uniref:hypothetical protein n=1 Tax=Escherichia sp. ESNIH1 TaxID=1985876 RepID=UPI000CDD6133|nr:hypothetical protein [Escherichia sp. ESNIH1]POU01099.1 hypothetical protein C3369_14455 [Escherichia sp. ESNIH1]